MNKDEYKRELARGSEKEARRKMHFKSQYQACRWTVLTLQLIAAGTLMNKDEYKRELARGSEKEARRKMELKSQYRACR